MMNKERTENTSQPDSLLGQPDSLLGQPGSLLGQPGSLLCHPGESREPVAVPRKKKTRFLSPRAIGTFAYCVSLFLIKTMRCRVVTHEKFDRNEQYIYAFWHDKQFAAIMLMPQFGGKKKVGLVSPSRDGEMLAVWLEHLGYETVRGSSSKKSISSLVTLLG